MDVLDRITIGAGRDKDIEMADCVICLDTFEPGTEVVQIPMCRHYFHEACCHKWFSSKT